MVGVAARSCIWPAVAVESPASSASPAPAPSTLAREMSSPKPRYDDLRERLIDPSSEVTDSKPAALRAEVMVLLRESRSPSLPLALPGLLYPPVLRAEVTVLLRESGSPSLTVLKLALLNPPVLRVEVARDMTDT